jgi:hypothetical protein
MRLARNFDASAVHRVQEAVIAATDRRPFDSSTGQRKMAMTAAILECGHLAVCAKEHNRLPQQGSGNRLVPKLPREAGNIPSIEGKHSGSIRLSTAGCRRRLAE